jgi:uncharacterized protein DUF6677
MDEQPHDIPAAESQEPQVAPSPEVVASEEPAAAESREFRALGIGFAGWLLPGLGHALQKMWGRALAVFFSVAALITLGAAMRGNVFTSQGDDAFATLGYLADLGSGAFYLIVRAMEFAGPDVSHSAGDYGTRFIATAGVLNLLAALHAYEAARGRKA